MSAWVVSKDTIDLLVSAGLRYEYGIGTGMYVYHDGQSENVQRGDADSVGRRLWTENLLSVMHRYPNDRNGEWPGPLGFRAEDIEAYRFQRATEGFGDDVDPVVVLKSIHCFEYQSCEHPEWRESWAYAYCRALERKMIGLLAGYEEAPWGWERNDQTEEASA